MLSFLESASMFMEVNLPPNRNFFTNNDTLHGQITLKTRQKISIKSLTVFLNVASSTILLDNKGTFLTCENRNIFTESIALVVENSFTSGTHRIPFKFTLPGQSVSEKIFNLPPSVKFIDGNDSTKIDYSIDAILTKQHSKSTLNANYLFDFLPQPQYSSFSLLHNSSLPHCSTEASFYFKYNSVIDGKFNVSESPQSERQRKMISFKRFSSREKKTASTFNEFMDIQCPFMLAIDFSHSKVLDNEFAKGVLNVPQDLKDSVSLCLISQYSAQELYAKLYKKEVNENNVFPEKLRLSEMRIDLVSVVSFCCGKKIFKNQNRKCLLGKSNLDYTIDLTKFRRMKRKDGVYYKYDIDTSIYDCIIRDEVSSFISSSVKLDHQLQIKADFVSLTSQSKASVSLNTDVLLLNDIYDEE
ncbi:hypothetical protein DASC09_056130 [Saccharomycopsis crataegensis]|uniref:Arrestin-like N-terminal domain-containing protein n=1 Tax=Saccharomycopsis crataegensis TaxID=43959 RepID=A0AAV5QU78_9ASCO|nr:hypothetical protein DASC09_056130 [Saccharomycopsis crataegensis]